MRRPAFRVGVAAVTLWLGACATPTAPPERVYSGRFAAIAISAERSETVSGLFTVEVRGARQTIDLSTPVGMTVARIEIEPGRAMATGPQMQTISGSDADQLIEGLIGWPLPVAGLVDWIDGRPSPDRPASTQRQGERVSEIVQDGWTIRYVEYSSVTQRPRRLLLERQPVGAGPALSVRVIVDEPAP
jgi:outer membrane lipoprotein LolB